MKVHELIVLLKERMDQDAEVGCTMSGIHGWVQKIDGLKVAEDGTVCIDQAEETMHTDEVSIK